MRMVANKTFKYPPTVTRHEGERFSAPEKDARVLIAVGFASQDLGELPAPAVVPVQVLPKRRYKTREMRAS